MLGSPLLNIFWDVHLPRNELEVYLQPWRGFNSLSKRTQKGLTHKTVRCPSNCVRPFSRSYSASLLCCSWFTIPTYLFHISIELNEMTIRVIYKNRVIDTWVKLLWYVFPYCASIFVEETNCIFELSVICQTDSKCKQLCIFTATKFLSQSYWV